VGQIIADSDTLGTPAAPLASGTTPVSAGSCKENDLKRTCRNDKQYECYPITTGPISVDADGNVTIAANPNGAYTVTYHL
jgi:hypothetical protein